MAVVAAEGCAGGAGRGLRAINPSLQSIQRRPARLYISCTVEHRPARPAAAAAAAAICRGEVSSPNALKQEGTAPMGTGRPRHTPPQQASKRPRTLPAAAWLQDLPLGRVGVHGR